MTNPISAVLREIEAREGMYEPMKCMLCWNEPAIEGALGADCLFKHKIQITEGEEES